MEEATEPKLKITTEGCHIHGQTKHIALKLWGGVFCIKCILPYLRG